MNIAKSIIEKRASAPWDLINSGISGSIGSKLYPITPIVNSIGEIIGLTDGDRLDDDQKIEFAGKNSLRSLIPGVGGHRIGVRQRQIAEDSKDLGARHPYANLTSEYVGPFSSMILPAAIGGGIGYGLSGDAGGATAGALSGAVIPGLAGAILAGIKDRRTRGEQAVKDDSGARAVAKYLVPGMATYDAYKRLGRSRDWDDKAKDERKNPKNPSDKDKRKKKIMENAKEAGIATETLGKLTQPLMAGGLGALGGSLLSDGAAGPSLGAILGLLANRGIENAADYTANQTPVRSHDAQDQANQEWWQNLLIPGHARYNQEKRQQNIRHTRV